jgi:hypothetical protein
MCALLVANGERVAIVDAEVVAVLRDLAHLARRDLPRREVAERGTEPSSRFGPCDIRPPASTKNR